MKKIQVRCVKGFGVIGNLHNIEVMRPLPGFGYVKKLYCCSNCGEIFVLDLNNSALKGAKQLPTGFNVACPNCTASLQDNFLPYPEYVFLSDGVEKMDVSTILYDNDSSLVEEYWLIET